jgi:hypothetical protein
MATKVRKSTGKEATRPKRAPRVEMEKAPRRTAYLEAPDRGMSRDREAPEAREQARREAPDAGESVAGRDPDDR